MKDRLSHAQAFRDLHRPGSLLILPNAWDAGSARLIESLGAPAIATSSAAVAWAAGYPDGNAIPVAALVRAVEAIARSIRIPLSVDSEGGYSDEPEQVESNIQQIAAAGAVGINLEDGKQSPELMVRKIEAAKRGGQRAGVDLFVNARVDALLRKLVPREQAVAETVRRSKLYAQAGCDGIFVPMLSAPEEIRQVVQGIDPLPLNVMAVDGLPDAAALRALGVRRLSAGVSIARAAMVLTKKLSAGFLTAGDSAAIYERIEEAIDMNGLLSRR